MSADGPHHAKVGLGDVPGQLRAKPFRDRDQVAPAQAGRGQAAHHQDAADLREPRPDDRRRGKGFQGAVQVFGDDHFRARAENAGFTFVPLGVGEQHGSHNLSRTHFQLHLDGEVHADVLLLESNRGTRGHHQVRDDILDDSILTVGKGAAATAGYGGENIEGHGARSLSGLSAAPSGNAAAPPGNAAAPPGTSAATASSAQVPAKVVHYTRR